MLILALAKPALSHPPANLAIEPTELHLDWFYLNIYPLLDRWQGIVVWGLVGTVTLFFAALPWLPPKRREPVATVVLERCNGCGRCFEDCPYSAIVMQPRSDQRRHALEPVVDAALCASCGICAGACPSSTPFRRIEQLTTGIDMPQFPIDRLRTESRTAAQALRGEARVLVYGCAYGADVTQLRTPGVAALSLPCIGLLPPSFVEYLLQNQPLDGVMVTGCGSGDCEFRLGNRWMEQRLQGQREPHLRARVNRERVRIYWASAQDQSALANELEAFRADLRMAVHHEQDSGAP
ncbi:hypothetical protein CCP3SC15_2400001 [Gammaproteobacteria bacterium]